MTTCPAATLTRERLLSTYCALGSLPDATRNKTERGHKVYLQVVHSNHGGKTTSIKRWQWNNRWFSRKERAAKAPRQIRKGRSLCVGAKQGRVFWSGLEGPECRGGPSGWKGPREPRARGHSRQTRGRSGALCTARAGPTRPQEPWFDACGWPGPPTGASAWGWGLGAPAGSLRGRWLGKADL